MSATMLAPAPRLSALDTREAHPRMSERYKFVDSGAIVNRLREGGWMVRATKEVKSSKEDNRGYQKHVVRFINPSFNRKSGLRGVGDTLPEILLINSHNGTTACQLRCGLYELVCENGLVIATDEFINARILHKGAGVEKVDAAIDAATSIFPKVYEKRAHMLERQLNPREKVHFAQKASYLRISMDDDYRIAPTTLLAPEFEEQAKDDLWSVYNVVQGHLVRGSYTASLKKDAVRKSTKPGRKARPITNISRDIALNSGLWELAESFLEA